MSIKLRQLRQIRTRKDIRRGKPKDIHDREVYIDVVRQMTKIEREEGTKIAWRCLFTIQGIRVEQ